MSAVPVPSLWTELPPGTFPRESTPDDPLLDCLEQVAAHHGINFSRDAVLAGLPVEDARLSPALLLRAAGRAGFQATLVERAVRRLPNEVLPAIVLLSGGRAGVLLPAPTGGRVELLIPGDDQAINAPAKILKRDYTGFAILLQPRGVESRPVADPRWWFWQTMWKFRSYYLRLMPAAFLLSLLALVMPIFIMLIYDRVVPNDATETLFVLALGVLIIFGFEFMLRLLRGFLLERSGRDMDLVLASSIYEQLLGIEMRARPPSSSVLAARTKAYEVLREFFMSATMLALTDLPFALIMVGTMFYLGGNIGWILVVAAAVALLLECLIQIPLHRSVVNASECGMERQAMVSETINGLESVKAANAEGTLQRRFDAMITESSQKDVRSHWYGLLGTTTTTSIINITTVMVVIAGVFKVKSGDLTMGGMIACVMLSSRTLAPIAMVAGLMTRLQQALQALKHLNAVMALPRETGGAHKFVQRHSFEIRYSLQNVSARYPGQPVPALSSISLQIAPGSRLGVLGRIGSGKSTFLRLLAKMYEPESGRILLDGVDLSQYHPAVLRRDIGYLLQDATVFRGTLRENVALGTHGATDEEILHALRLAGLEEFVKRNQRGLDAQVGEQGSMLSGGQRQALVLARTLLARPRMLLLDEPTASMDPQTEKQFIQGLRGYLAQDPRRTLVVATHKTSMLDLVDQILVLDDGRMVAHGDKSTVLSSLASPKGQPSPSVAMHTA